MLKGIFSHTDKYGKLWFNFVPNDNDTTIDDTKAKLKRHCDEKGRVPYTTNYFIVTCNKKITINADTYGAAPLAIRVNLQKYSYSGGDVGNETINGTKLMLIDISK